ncbi:MAG: hypothetical protein ACYCZA_09140 [Thiobacillus sp.]
MPVTTHSSSLLIQSILMVALLWAMPKPALAETEHEGFVPEITTQQLFFNGTYYVLVQGGLENNRTRWPQATECYIKGNPTFQVTCGTLAQVGYIDKAKIRIEGKKVMRVEVLELMQ